MPFSRGSSARFNGGRIMLMFSSLVSATLLAHAQNGAPNASQTVVADSSNNGLSSPGAVAVDTDENVFIADTGNNRVVEESWNKNTKTYDPQTVLIGNLNSPDSVAVGKRGDVFVADTGNNRIIEIPWNRTSGTYGTPAAIGSGLDSPHGVAVAANGDVYIADTDNGRVVDIAWDRDKQTYGAQTTVGNNLLRPAAVAVDSGGKLYIANLGDSSVVELPAGCNAAKSCSSQTTLANQGNNGLANPTGIAVGPSGNLYIADTGNNRMIVLPWNASMSAYGAQKEIGDQLVGPEGIALNAMGNVYIADTGNNRVIRIAQSSSPSREPGGFRRRP